MRAQTLATPSLWLSLLLLGCPSNDKPIPTPNVETPSEDNAAPEEPAKAAPDKPKLGLSDNATENLSAKNRPDPKVFVEAANEKLRALWTESSKAEWAKSTNITPQTEQAAAEAHAKVMVYETKVIKQAARFSDIEASPEVERQIERLKLTALLPAPNDDDKRKELAEIVARMEGIYGKGKVCDDDGKNCRDLGEVSAVLAESRDEGQLRELWTKWREVSVPMRDDYERFVSLANEGARDLGFAHVTEIWQSQYDMEPKAFVAEMNRLWGQVKPLYDALHCHVRAELVDKYGVGVVPPDGPLPAHLLGNMWAQDWSNLYPMLEPYPGEASLDVTKALQDKGTKPLDMVKMGEGFFTSLGLDDLPKTFWERSMFTKPSDREVVCHASAWDVTLNNDLRIKMCIRINHEDLVTIHHELGHIYYYNAYHELPVLFQSGAHDGFHEAIGDAIALSITPGYLKTIGLLQTVSDNDKGVINKQMQDALQKVAFLPFGKLVDEWRWGVFAGDITPADYNTGWWALRRSVQGVAAPSKRPPEKFDPGAKYHIPANTPYARYFLAHILQFQFHKSLCEAAGHTGPLHTCSIYGSKEAGAKLQAMLELGASKPWPVALEAMTGSKTMDAAPLIEYFTPLMKYLDEQNKGRKCGW